MNGRLYDAATGRFLSADPTIQYADDMQNYNRYSYINNNPLSAVDYSGYGWNPFKAVGKLFKKIAKAIKSILKNKIIRIAASIGLSIYGPGFIGSTDLFGGALFDYADIISGGLAGFAGSGGSVKAAIQGAVSGGLFKWAGGVGTATGEYGVAHYAAHAAAGCASAVIGGGNCGRGAVSAVAGKAGTWASDGNMAVAVVAGGTASLASGGKFANGAVTSAFGYLFNCMQHPTGCSSDNGLKEQRESFKRMLALDEQGIQPVYFFEEVVFGVPLATIKIPKAIDFIYKNSDIIYYGFEAAAAILGSASPIATDTMLPRQEYVNLSNSYDINKQQEFNKNSQRPFKIPIRIKKFP